MILCKPLNRTPPSRTNLRLVSKRPASSGFSNAIARRRPMPGLHHVDIDPAACPSLAASSGAGQVRGVPLGAPPLETPVRPTKTERKEQGQSVPLPLRATMLKLLRLPFFRSLARREFPKSRPATGAILISPMLFIISESRRARFISRRCDRSCLPEPAEYGR